MVRHECGPLVTLVAPPPPTRPPPPSLVPRTRVPPVPHAPVTHATPSVPTAPPVGVGSPSRLCQEVEPAPTPPGWEDVVPTLEARRQEAERPAETSVLGIPSVGPAVGVAVRPQVVEWRGLGTRLPVARRRLFHSQVTCLVCV